jgi:hypothetical protein
MRDDELTPEQQAEIQKLQSDWERHCTRAAVDMRAAMPRLREHFPSTRREISATEFELSETIDLSGIVETLRGLPDGAGTDAFIAAYNRRPGHAGSNP